MGSAGDRLSGGGEQGRLRGECSNAERPYMAECGTISTYCQVVQEDVVIGDANQRSIGLVSQTKSQVEKRTLIRGHPSCLPQPWADIKVSATFKNRDHCSGHANLWRLLGERAAAISKVAASRHSNATVLGGPTESVKTIADRRSWIGGGPIGRTWPPSFRARPG